MSGSIRIVEMPNLGAVNDASSVVGERAGSGRFAALALKNYTSTGLAPTISVPGLNARSYGATGDGVTDDTAALQAAIDAAVAAQQALYIPGGRYLISAALNIRRGVRITGAYVEPQVTMFGGTPNTGGAGTWIVLDGTHLVSAFYINPAGTPSANNQATGVEISHLGIYHTQPALGVGWAPAAYPPAIEIPAGSDVYLHHICLLNPTTGIRAAGQSAGRVVIERIHGQPLQQGIVLDNQTDIVTIRDVHFWVYWSLDTNVLAYQKANGYALVLGRTDDPVIDNFFCLWYWAGVRIQATANGVTSNARFTNCDFDQCRFPFLMSGASSTHTAFLSGCALLCPPDYLLSSCLKIQDTVTSSVVSLVGCWLFDPGISCVEMASAGNHVRLSGCYLQNWDQGNTGKYCLNAGLNNTIRMDAGTVTFSTHSVNNVLQGKQCLRTPGLAALKGTMLAAGTSAVVPHLLDTIPDLVLVTPNTTLGAATQWWATADASNVTVSVNANPGHDVPFSVLLGQAQD